jgi:hypothetical protein
MMKICNMQNLLAEEIISGEELQDIKGGLTLSYSGANFQANLTVSNGNISGSATFRGNTSTFSWGIADDDKRRERPGGVQTQ